MKRKIKQLLLIFVLVELAYITSGYLLKEEKSFTVSKTERVGNEYLIYTDNGVFKNTDDWRFFKFNSSDLYSTLSGKINQKVQVQTVGFRIPFFSMYENIISLTPPDTPPSHR